MQPPAIITFGVITKEMPFPSIKTEQSTRDSLSGIRARFIAFKRRRENFLEIQTSRSLHPEIVLGYLKKRRDSTQKRETFTIDRHPDISKKLGPLQKSNVTFI